MENITRLSYISIRKANGDIIPDSPVPFVTNSSNIKIETLEDEKNLYTELLEKKSDGEEQLLVIQKSDIDELFK